MRTIAGTVLFAALAATVFGQSTLSANTPASAAADSAAPAAPNTPVKFEIADIHPSPQRRFPFFDGGFLVNGRYMLWQATLADLVATAYGLKDATYVHGGPSWLEWDRWDVIAKVPPGTTEATAKQMLQPLLAQRFGLVVHPGSAPMPAYVLTAPGGKSKLKESDGTGDSGCKGQPQANQTAGATPQILVTCHNETMEKFADDVHVMAGGYLTDPVVDSTGLKGAYDFDIHWTPRQALANAGSEGVSIFDAVDKELGLKLALETAPRPVLIVESVNETPTPNAPDLAKIMPPLPPAHFEVATIKPSAPDEKPNGGGIQRDGLSFHALPLKFLISFAWDLNGNDINNELSGAPKWLDSDMIDLDAKVAVENMVQGSSTMQGIPPIALGDLREMLKQLLIERFEMKIHTEDRPQDAYTLVAVAPKMTKADPTERTLCKQGPGPDGKDPRFDHPILNMLVTCQNVTMAQAGELFPTFAAWYLHYPVVDKTGLQGGWDFTVNWSSGDHMMNPGGQGQGSPDAGSESASDPNGAVSFYDAVSKDLGLKLVKEKRPEPVLVIDHIDEQPTPN